VPDLNKILFAPANGSAHMRRRDFIKTIAGSAAAWPVGALAQQPGMPVIGFLHSASPEGTAKRLATFLKGLNETGFVEGTRPYQCE
jgi:putative ABC transport system substrate-binding protein